MPQAGPEQSQQQKQVISMMWWLEAETVWLASVLQFAVLRENIYCYVLVCANEGFGMLFIRKQAC